MISDSGCGAATGSAAAAEVVSGMGWGRAPSCEGGLRCGAPTPLFFDDIASQSAQALPDGSWATMRGGKALLDTVSAVANLACDELKLRHHCGVRNDLLHADLNIIQTSYADTGADRLAALRLIGFEWHRSRVEAKAVVGASSQSRSLMELGVASSTQRDAVLTEREGNLGPRRARQARGDK
ncbi:hypothetical protein HYQ46_005748 [Verticillium longisporum]|nr:hypothetical protein HYQ46_005748 [Verticillium longisporum]